jgi:TRAP-type C4-dicarboxylate transport system permease large subunit
MKMLKKVLDSAFLFMVSLYMLITDMLDHALNPKSEMGMIIKNSAILGLIISPVVSFVVYTGQSEFSNLASNFYMSLCLLMTLVWLPIVIFAFYKEVKPEPVKKDSPIPTMLEIPKAIIMELPKSVKPKAEKKKKNK